jgi:hypothetical protein
MFNIPKTPTILVKQSDKICIHCKYYLSNNDPTFGKCLLFPVDNTENDKISYLVSGIKSIEPVNYLYCSTARLSYNMCGEKGRLYEEK